MLNSQAQVLHQTLVASHSSGLLLGHESDVDVGHNTTGGDGGTSHKLGELVVVTDSELDVTGDDSGSLLLTSAVSGELEDLSCEVLKDGCEVDGGTGTDSLGEAASTELTAILPTGNWRPARADLLTAFFEAPFPFPFPPLPAGMIILGLVMVGFGLAFSGLISADQIA